MFRIERSIVQCSCWHGKNHHAIIITSFDELENCSFTFIDAEDYAAESSPTCVIQFSAGMARQMYRTLLKKKFKFSSYIRKFRLEQLQSYI
jgi:hypothetical protein